MTEPSPRVQGEDKRREAHWLASLLLACGLVVGIMSPAPFLLMVDPSQSLIQSVVALICSAACILFYLVSRLGYIRRVKLALAIFATAVVFIASLTLTGTYGLRVLYFLTTIIIFSCSIVRIRTTLVIFVAQWAIIFLLFPLISPMTPRMLLEPFNFNLLITSIMVLVTYHRKRLDKERADQLHLSEERYKNLVSTVKDIIYEQDIHGKIISINEAVRSTLGYAPEEVIGVHVSLFIHPDDYAMTDAMFKDALHGLEILPSEYRLKAKSGEIHWVESQITPQYKNGRMVRISGVARDITKRKQAEEALKLSEERYRIISELSSDFAFSYKVHPEGTLEDEWLTEGSFLRVTGYTFAEVRGTLLPVYPEDAHIVQEYQARTIKGETTESEHRILTKGGESRWVHMFRQPIFDEQGQVIRYYGVAQDITERKQAEEALKLSEERYRIISEIISDYTYYSRIDTEGKPSREWITGSFAKLTGYAPEEMGHYRDDTERFFYPEDVPNVRADRKRMMNNERFSGTYRIITKDGRIRWLLIDRLPVWGDEENRVVGYYGVARDITERKEAEDALRRSEERYRKISEMISDYAYYYRIEPDGKIVREWITDSVTRVTGYTPDETPGGDRNTTSMFHPDEEARVEKHREMVQRGEIVSDEYRIITKWGEERWLFIDRQPVWNEDKTRPIGYYGVAKDVTDRKHAEARMIKMALEQDRMKMVERFMLAIQHDFRTSLATIETSRYLVERFVSSSPEATEKVMPKLNTIQRAVMHMGEQLENMHMVSSLTNPHPKLCNWNQLVEAVVRDYSPKAEQKSVHITFLPDPTLLAVKVDEDKLKIAIQHLVVNAVSHSDADSDVVLRTLHRNGIVLLEVEDNGRGIAPESLPHIFDLFYRADDSRNQEWGGVGLGLTIVRMVVEAHGGTVNAKSRAGVGSIFSIELPAVFLDTVSATD